MPLLSLIFSALFILFGTVVIQAFRLADLMYTFFVSVISTVQRKPGGRGGVGGGGKAAMLLISAIPVHDFWNFSPCFFSDSSDDKQTKPKAKDGTKAENGSSGSSSTSRQDYNFSSVACGSEMHEKCFSALRFFSVDFSRPPKKNFVEVTELTDITYMSNLVKLRPGHMNIVLVLTDASKNILLSKFAKEVYSFTG